MGLFRPRRAISATQTDRRVAHAARATAEAVEGRLLFATFTVTNVGDTGVGSLRQAILDANAAPGADVVAFDIPGAGIHTITPTLDILPASTGPLLVDGATQPGYAGRPLIELSGAAGRAGGWAAAGLVLNGAGSGVRGLTVNRFAGYGIALGGADSFVAGS